MTAAKLEPRVSELAILAVGILFTAAGISASVLPHHLIADCGRVALVLGVLLLVFGTARILWQPASPTNVELGGSLEPTTAGDHGAAAREDLVLEFQRLAVMHSRGQLTEEQFGNAKAHLLR